MAISDAPTATSAHEASDCTMAVAPAPLESRPSTCRAVGILALYGARRKLHCKEHAQRTTFNKKSKESEKTCRDPVPEGPECANSRGNPPTLPNAPRKDGSQVVRAFTGQMEEKSFQRLWLVERSSIIVLQRVPLMACSPPARTPPAAAVIDAAGKRLTAPPLIFTDVRCCLRSVDRGSLRDDKLGRFIRQRVGLQVVRLSKHHTNTRPTLSLTYREYTACGDVVGLKAAPGAAMRAKRPMNRRDEGYAAMVVDEGRGRLFVQHST